MIQIRRMKMNWRIRRLEMQMKRWSSWYREEYQCWKLCRKNTFPVKRECWCICNIGMYSSMYLMYCNPMFILGCIYYVFESCCHAPMPRRDPDRAMIQIQLWWLREIQIEWWSRSNSDDLDRVMIQILWWCSMMIQIERWSRSRWLEDEDDLKMNMIQ